jgi:hypothetical protein
MCVDQFVAPLTCLLDLNKRPPVALCVVHWRVLRSCIALFARLLERLIRRMQVGNSPCQGASSVINKSRAEEGDDLIFKDRNVELQSVTPDLVCLKRMSMLFES